MIFLIGNLRDFATQLADSTVTVQVKKGLEQLYKKVDKQLCEEENLLQVSRVQALS